MGADAEVSLLPTRRSRVPRLFSTNSRFEPGVDGSHRASNQIQAVRKAWRIDQHGGYRIHISRRPRSSHTASAVTVGSAQLSASTEKRMIDCKSKPLVAER